MHPVRGWKIVEREEDVLVFFQALAGLRVFVPIQTQKLIIEGQGILFCRRLIHLMDQRFGLGLQFLGQLIQNVGRLVYPAALMPRSRIDLFERLPEPHRRQPLPGRAQDRAASDPAAALSTKARSRVRRRSGR